MFEDIAQMEKEIEEFRKNIIASSSLVEGIANLTEATKQQKESFLAESNRLISDLKIMSEEDYKIRKEELNRIKEELENSKTEFINEIAKVQNSLHVYQTDAETKHNDFVKRLEDTNIEQLAREMQELKHSVGVKSVIAIVGIFISIVVSLVGLFIK